MIAEVNKNFFIQECEATSRYQLYSMSQEWYDIERGKYKCQLIQPIHYEGKYLTFRTIASSSDKTRIVVIARTIWQYYDIYLLKLNWLPSDNIFGVKAKDLVSTIEMYLNTLEEVTNA